MGWLMISSIVFLLLHLSQSQSQSDTTIFNYTVFNEGDPSLILQGDAHVTPGSPIAQLIATDDSVFPGIPLPRRTGRIMHSQPIRLWDRAGRRQANFQTRFRCFIGNRGSNNHMGDGISFFIAPVNTTIPQGSWAGHMAIYGSPSGNSPTPLFAVELDVFPDSWDPLFRHVGININSRRSLAVDRWDIRATEVFVDVTITYDALTRRITAVASSSANARVEYRSDLKWLLPEWVQIGLSASTAGGSVVAIHEIHTWSFNSFLVSEDGVTNAAADH